MSQKRPSRREVIESCISRGLLLAGAPMVCSSLFKLWAETEGRTSKPTPAEALGPFFKKGAPNTSTLRAPGDPGFPLHVFGKVVNTRAELVQGAQIDVWQTDHQGRYDLQGYRY